MMMRKFTNHEGFIEHCKVAALIINEMGINPHTKHHIRGAIREASNKVTFEKGSGKDKAHFMSEGALSHMKSGNTDNLVLEHGVPISIMNDFVLRLDNVTYTDIADIVKKYTVLAVITEEEDSRLSENKLTKTMPKGWDNMDKFARYDAVGIKLVGNQYKELKKKINS